MYSISSLSRTLTRALITLIYLFLLCGCSLLGLPTSATVTTQKPLPTTIEIHSTPFFPQTKNQCGAAALATLLNHRGISITPTALEPRLYIPKRKGSLAVELIAQARQEGALTYTLEPTLDALLQEVAAGHPVLVLQNLGLSWLPQWHFAVIIGYDLQANTITLRSGTEARVVTPIYTFLNTWKKGNHWALVTPPPHEIPVTATAPNYLQSASQLEQVAQFKAAYSAYQTAAYRWPDFASTAYIGLANIDYAKEHFLQAKHWLGKALEKEAARAGIWNNLAYVLKALECHSQTHAAIQCARALAPDNPYIQASEKELLPLSSLTTAPGNEDACKLTQPITFSLSTCSMIE